MKKSQVLAALALAFALGVVAPVVSTTNTVSAYTAADASAKPPVKGSATKADVLNAVAAIEANQTYKNMTTLYNAIKELNDADSEYAKTTSVGNLNTTIRNVLTGDDLNAYEKVWTNINDQYNDKSITNSDLVASVIAEAKKADYYQIIAPIFTAYNNGVDPNKTDFINAVNAFNSYFANNTGAINENTMVYTTVLNNVETVFNAKLNDIYNTSVSTYYSKYKALVEEVNSVEETNNKYIAGYNALTTAFNADGVLNTNGKITLAKMEAGTYGTMNRRNVALDTMVTTLINPTNSDYNMWVGNPSVRTVIDDASKGAINVDSNDNYNLIINLATEYAKVTGNNTQTVQEIAATLVGYKAPAESKQNTLTEGPVTVTGAFPADLKLSVVKSDKKIAAFGDAKYGMWDINLIDAKNNKVTYNGSVMVTIAVPEGIDATKSSVYYVNDQGKVEKLAARVENGKMVFTTSHFSLYAIVEDNGKNFGINAPDTGIVMNTESGASTTVAMVAGVATALTAAGAGVVAYRNARRSTRK